MAEIGNIRITVATITQRMMIPDDMSSDDLAAACLVIKGVIGGYARPR